MGRIILGGGIIGGVSLALYIVIFLITLPVMANAPRSALPFAVNLYATLYTPVRDAIPSDNFIHGLWRDYEHYWCGGSAKCKL